MILEQGLQVTISVYGENKKTQVNVGNGYRWYGPGEKRKGLFLPMK
jgi:hypothetical protein